MCVCVLCVCVYVCVCRERACWRFNTKTIWSEQSFNALLLRAAVRYARLLCERRDFDQAADMCSKVGLALGFFYCLVSGKLSNDVTL